MRPVSGTTSPLFLAVGKPGYNFRTAVLQLVSMAVLIAALLPHRALGVAIAVVSAFCIGFAHNLHLACRHTGIGVRPALLLRALLLDGAP